MNLNEYLNSNPEIQHNVKAIIRLQLQKDKINQNTNYNGKEQEIKKIDDKIKINMDLLKQFVKTSYEEVSVDEIQTEMIKLKDKSGNDYDKTQSYKYNYNKALNELEFNMEDKKIELDDEIYNDDNTQDLDDTSDEIEDIEDFEIDNEENEEVNPDITNIKYDSKSDMYFIDTPDGNSEVKNISMNLYEMKESRLRKLYGEDYDDIFNKISENNIKKYDARLLFLLWEKMGKEEAINYLDEFSKGKNADKSKLNYTMKYDIGNVKKNKDLSKKEKKQLLKITKRNKYVAKTGKVKEKKSKKILARAGLVALGLTSLIGATASIREDTKKEALINKNISNTIEPKTDNNNNKFVENKDNVTTSTNFKDKYKVPSTNIEKTDNAINNYVNTKNKEHDEAMKQFKLGSILELGEGINYTEDSMGCGEKGEIGVTPWRPAGQYEVNGISILNEKNEIVTYEINKTDISVQDYIKSNMPKGGKVSFHIMQLKNGEKRPTGWVESEVIYKALDEKYKEQKDVMEL